MEAAGITVVEGDVTSADSVLHASEGCAAIVHSAASLGGATQDPAEHVRTNVDGARHALDAGARHGIRVVALTTALYLDFSTRLTEASGLAPEPRPTRTARPRCRLTGTSRRAPTTVRTWSSESWNRAVRAAINGRIDDYLMNMPTPWVLAEDTARATVSAWRQGTPGATDLAFGAEDAADGAPFLNLACEVAGVTHRVRELWLDDGNEPEILARFGPSLVANAKRRWPVPWFDNRHTCADLGYAPRSLRDAMAITVDWLRREGQIPVQV